MASSSSQRRIGLKFESACHILAVVLMLAACPLFAADPNTITVSNFKKTSHNSLTLHRQQSVIQCIELARAAIAREDYVGAIQLMEQAQREPNSFVPAGDDSVVASHEAVKRMWDVIPAETRQRFDEARVGASRREWSSVRTKSLHEVVRFLNLFQDLPISVDALWWIAAHQRDHAQFQQAVSTYLRIVSHQHTNATNRAIAMQAADELIILGAPSVRGEWNQCCSLIDPMTTVDDHGKSTTFGEWVASRNQSVLTEPGELSRSDIDLQRLKGPCSIPVWSHALTVRLEGGLQLHESKLREQGVVPLPIQRPLLTDRLLVIRSLEQISAFDIESGDSRWSIPNIEYSRLRQQVFDNLTYRAEAVDWAQRRSLADSIFGRMSTDGKRLYAVQEPDRDGELKISRDLSRDSHRLGPRYNQLVAYELSTGREIWNIDGAGSDETFANMVFLGVPLVVDDQLYVIGQQETQLRFLAINSNDGSLNWSLDLGSTLLPISEDLQRSRVACPVAWHQGIVFCSTSVGGIVAIDSLQRSLKWGYRYPASTIAAGDLKQGPNQFITAHAHEPWWDSWREPYLAVFPLSRTENNESVLLFASPETDQLHALRVEDGQRLWIEPRAAALTVAGVSGTSAVLIEGQFLRGHDIATGKLLWRTGIPEPGGVGAFAGKIYTLTARNGGLLHVDSETGELTAFPGPSVTGVLTKLQASWYAVSRDRMSRLPELDEILAKIVKKLSDQPENQDLKIEAASLEIEAGLWAAARSHLKSIPSEKARGLKRQAAFGLLASNSWKTEGLERDELISEIKQSSQSYEERFDAACLIGRMALKQNEFELAVSEVLETIGDDSDQSEDLMRTSSVNVRRDRVLLGIIDDAYRVAPRNQLPQLDQHFKARIANARKSRDRFAMQRLAEQWQGLDWSRTLLVQDEERVLRQRNTIDAELQLLDAAGCSDPQIARLALERLAERMSRSSATRFDAARIRQRINQISGTVQSVQELAPEAGRKWPAIVPTVSVREERSFDVFFLAPIQSDPGSIVEQLDVCIDRNGNEVRFRGLNFFQEGLDENRSQKLQLPPTVSHYRGAAGYMLRQGWGVGRIVILLVGSELFAIAPLNQRNEPIPELVWASPIDLQSSLTDTRIVADTDSNGTIQHLVVDQSNRRIGLVGPVRPGYFCYQKGTKLVAAQTSTGHRIWEHLDFPADAIALGDDHQVYIWSGDRTVEVLSAIDGRRIDVRRVNAMPSQLIHSDREFVWTAIRGDELNVQKMSLQTGHIVWSKSLPPTSLVAMAGTEAIAITINEQVVQFFDAITGGEIGQALEMNSANASMIQTWSDFDRIYVAVGHATEKSNQLRRIQSNEGYRLPFVSGTLFAVDRANCNLLWKRELDDEPIAQDQSRTSPVLIQLWKTSANGTVVRVRVLDKRTGDILWERENGSISSYFLLNPDLMQGILELKLAQQVVRLDYSEKELQGP